MPGMKIAFLKRLTKDYRKQFSLQQRLFVVLKNGPS
jgi:hypothetical protein